jgi:hypothetical protein
MTRRRLFVSSILLGTLVMGPLVSCLVSIPHDIVFLKREIGSVTFAMLLSRANSRMVGGMIMGFVGGVVCGRVRCEPRRAALQTTRVMLVLAAVPSLALYLLAWRSVTPSSVLGFAAGLAQCGLAAALTGYLTALLAGWSEEQWEQPEPPQLSTSRPRPTRYRI